MILCLSSLKVEVGEGLSAGEALGLASPAWEAIAEHINRATRVIRIRFMVVACSLNAKATGCNPFLRVQKASHSNTNSASQYGNLTIVLAGEIFELIALILCSRRIFAHLVRLILLGSFLRRGFS